VFFCLIHIHRAQIEIIIEYNTSIYGVPELSHISSGFKYAKINEKISMVFDLYKSEVIIAKIVFKIKNRNVIHVQSIQDDRVFVDSISST
jgi:hypothetical protein